LEALLRETRATPSSALFPLIARRCTRALASTGRAQPNAGTFINPCQRDRDMVCASMGPGDFIEVFAGTRLDVCKGRTPKGLKK
jgi:adenylylsulfate kinase-like enzyme